MQSGNEEGDCPDSEAEEHMGRLEGTKSCEDSASEV